MNNNSTITNDPKDIQTTKSPIVETLSPNQAITQVPLSNNP